MSKKVVILVDGQNLYYSLSNMGILEKDVNWTKVFSSMIDQEDELIRTYWFRPAKIQDTHFTERNIQNQIIYKNHRTHLQNYKDKCLDKVPQTVQDKIQAACKSALAWIVAQKQRFAQIEYAYDQLCLSHNGIEMVKTGVVKIDPYRQDYIGEKGVDISLAVKMISLSVENKCDKIILVSGDYDYFEAIKYVKNNMTKLNVVKIHKGIPPKNRSMSRDLCVLADKVIDIYEEDIKGKFKME